MITFRYSLPLLIANALTQAPYSRAVTHRSDGAFLINYCTRMHSNVDNRRTVFAFGGHGVGQVTDAQDCHQPDTKPVPDRY